MTSVRDDAQIDEDSFVEAARCGDNQSFEVLVEYYHTPILNYLLRQTGDHELARDLTQQTFLDAFRDLSSLPGDRPFRAWLYRIARNNMLSECRRRRIRQVVSMSWLLDKMGVEPGPLQMSDSTGVCHERDLVQQVLEGMSPLLKEALLLHSLGGFLSEEIAHIVGISPATARQRICRAKEQFRLRYHLLNGDDSDTTVQSTGRSVSSIC